MKTVNSQLQMNRRGGGRDGRNKKRNTEPKEKDPVFENFNHCDSDQFDFCDR